MIKVPSVYIVAFFVACLSVAPLIALTILATDAEQYFDSYNIEIVVNTLSLMSLTALGAVLLGVPLAILLTYTNLAWKRFWLILLVSPLAVPSYLGAFTFFAAFGAGGELEGIFGFQTPKAEGLIGASLVMSLFTYPFVLLTTRAALASLEASQIAAARLLGLSLYKSIWFVVLPRIKNGISAGALLAALYALSDFGTPAIMGLNTFTRVIYVEYNAFGLSQAAMLSLQLLVVVMLILYLEAKVAGTKEPPSNHFLHWLNKRERVFCWTFFIAIVCLTIVLPLFVFLLWLWRDGIGNFDFYYAWNSAQASLLASLVAIVLALPLAFAAIKGRAGRLMERVTFIGFGIPGIVIGTAFVYVGLQLTFLYQSLLLLVVAYVLRFLPLAVSAIRSSAENIDGSLESAARVLGATKREAFNRITLPLTMRGVIAGAALVFLESMRELPATLLLGPTGYETLATYLWRVYEAGYFGLAAIPGLLLLFISGLGLAVMFKGEKLNEYGDVS